MRSRTGSSRLSSWRVACVTWVISAVVQAAAQSGGAPKGRDSAAEAAPSTQTSVNTGAESDLQRGIGLARQGRFSEAIPFLLASKARGDGGYTAEFNLALCYVGSERYHEAIAQLTSLHEGGFSTAAMSNLLAQAYTGEHDQGKAWPAIEAAVRQAPTDEKMYAFLLNACTDHYEYALGLKTATLGLLSLPQSARLHYERAVFLARLDRLGEAEPEFQRAAALDPKGDIGSLAAVQKLLYEDDLPHALDVARRAVEAGHRDAQMLSLLGTVLLYMGVSPGQPQFAEAKSALEAAVKERPGFSTAQIALGKLYLLEGRSADAVAHLEAGRNLEPQNPAVYASLASAYRKVGRKEESAECLKTLARLLEEKARTGPAVGASSPER